jgi:transposase InsO family protein
MPWKERSALDERKRFIQEWSERSDEPFGELCARFGISRPTGYKWVERYRANGEAGLEELSRAPRHSPQQMSEAVREAILELRRVHGRWGARKLLPILRKQQPAERWPAASTVSELLRREGLAHPRRQRQRTPPCSQPLQHAQAPNQVWCADYKGWFCCGDGTRCDPLTITDAFSRYLLRCRAVERTDDAHAQVIFEAVFREYGLPEAMRTDNGPPFATAAPQGLSRLSIWWLHLGIRHERIRPGHPEQNGRHERMHQTLKQETAAPPRANLARQQAAFREFEQEYNHLRPHEALEYDTPAQRYQASARRYPERLPEIEYAAGMQLRRISSAGEMKWNAQDTYISRVLAGETVGLREIEAGLYELYLGELLLGWFDSDELCFVADRAPRWHAPCTAKETEAAE